MHEVKAKSILSTKNGMNIYRGCTHGCIYCDSRSKCYQMKHAFEDIEVKINAPELLEDALRKKRKKCMISTGAMTDPYIPLEMNLRYMRKCLEIIEKYGFGINIITKSNRILRDLDLLKRINEKAKCVVSMTLTTYDDSLCKILEPNVSLTSERFETLMTLKEHGIPTVVWFCPILPYINDTEENIRGILDYCLKAEVKGILCFGICLTLREGNREYYYQKLDKHFPGLKERYIREYGNSYVLHSRNHHYLMNIIKRTCNENNIMIESDKIFSYLNEFSKGYEQLSFDI